MDLREKWCEIVDWIHLTHVRVRCDHCFYTCNSVVDIATRYGLDGPASNPGGGDIFRNRPDRPWGPPSLPYNGYRVSFPGVKRPGRSVDHPPTSRAEVKERVEL